MTSRKSKKMKDRLISASNSNKSPPIWVLQRTQDMQWHPQSVENRSRNWRRTKIGNRIRKKIKKEGE